jgi:hypothetical protein
MALFLLLAATLTSGELSSTGLRFSFAFTGATPNLLYLISKNAFYMDRGYNGDWVAFRVVDVQGAYFLNASLKPFSRSAVSYDVYIPAKDNIHGCALLLFGSAPF